MTEKAKTYAISHLEKEMDRLIGVWDELQREMCNQKGVSPEDTAKMKAEYQERLDEIDTTVQELDAAIAGLSGSGECSQELDKMSWYIVEASFGKNRIIHHAVCYHHSGGCLKMFGPYEDNCTHTHQTELTHFKVVKKLAIMKEKPACGYTTPRKLKEAQKAV